MATDFNRLFFHNPPKEPDLRRRTFIDREGELALLREIIASGTPQPLIQAIHGDSRIGKSHLVFQFLLDLPEDEWNKFEVHASEGLEARIVLKDLYREVLVGLNDVRDFEMLEPEGVSSKGIWKEALAEGRWLESLVCDAIKSREEIWSAGRKDTWGGKLHVTVFELSDVSEQSETETVKVTLQPPTEHQIVELIGRFLEVLGMATGKRVIVYVDDLDLLEREIAADRKQVALLKRLLVRLAEFENVVVAATLRTRQLTHLQKGLFDALRVRKLGANLTRQVHDVHIELFNDGDKIFDDECLEALVDDADGLIGRFLRNCRNLMMWARQQGRSAGRLLTRQDLEDFVQAELQQLGGKSGYPRYMARVQQAVRDNLSEVELDLHVLETELIFFILDEPSDPALEVFPISTLAAQVIRKLQSEEAEPLNG